MNIALFYHSLVSDWNHGNAHFLRGVVCELLHRGHEVTVYEPADGWSRQNLVEQHGLEPIEAFYKAYPDLVSVSYTQDNLDLEAVADEADLVIVHEWNEPWLINSWGLLRARRSNFRLLFHDTHHRAVSDPASIENMGLEPYDGVLAFGEVLSEVYRAKGWGRAVWTWHEAADTRMFYPRACAEDDKTSDLIWIGNWGDDERTQELQEFLFGPTQAVGAKLRLHGVRYPEDVLKKLARQGVEYGGWLPNFKAPDAFARSRVTVHVPRRPYTQILQGIPTIRPFEAMACGIPLISAPWPDREGLFTAGEDYLTARDGKQMEQQLRAVLNDQDFAQAIARQGLKTIRERHTCAHRVDELIDVCAALGVQGCIPKLSSKLRERQPEALFATAG